MRRFLPLLMMVLLIGCSQAPGGAPTARASAAPGSPGGPTAERSELRSVATAERVDHRRAAGEMRGGPGGIPHGDRADRGVVQSGNGDARRPGERDQATSDKAFELLSANGGRAPYSCSEVGLEWAYFDANSPWDAILAVAADAAPGTVAYLTGLRAMSALDVAKLSDYGIAGCDDAVKTIKQRVAAQTASGTKGVEKMPFDAGVKLLGLYKAYIRSGPDRGMPARRAGQQRVRLLRLRGLRQLSGTAQSAICGMVAHATETRR